MKKRKKDIEQSLHTIFKRRFVGDQAIINYLLPKNVFRSSLLHFMLCELTGDIVLFKHLVRKPCPMYTACKLQICSYQFSFVLAEIYWYVHHN